MVSMLGVRSTLPTLLPVALYSLTSRRTRTVVAGVVIGAALVLGTEQGLAVLMAYIVVSAFLVMFAHDRRPLLRDVATTLAAAVAAVLILLLIIGGPRGVAGALRYNLRLVPGDQFWYFGAPDSVFAPDWPSVFILMRQMPRIPLALVGAIATIAVYLRRLRREPEGDAGRRHAALAVLAVYGLISCAAILGIFFHTYVEPCLRALLLLGALELDRILSARNSRRGLVIVAAGMTPIMIAAAPHMVGATLSTLPHVVRDHVVRGDPPTAEGIWPQTLAEGQRVVDQHRGPGGLPPVLWSVYSGWLEARNGTFNPTSFDYAMHALGPANRAAYVADFRRVKPALVQTVLPTYLMAELWFEQTSWPFYEELLRNYGAIAGTPWSIFWERLPAPNPAPVPVWSAHLPDGAQSVELPVANQFRGDTSVVLLSVGIKYTVHNSLRVLPFVGAMPRYFVSVEGAISRFPVTLDPLSTTGRFPVIAVRGRNPVLRFATHSLLPGARIDVHAVDVSVIAINSTNVGWLANLIEEQRRRQPLGPGNDSTGLYRWR
jgi:hypothetical protein